MNEEDLKARVTQMVRQKKSEAYIKSYIADYRAKMNSPENEAVQEKEGSPQEESTSIPKESSIDQDWWDNSGLDRNSYFDEQGNMMPEPDILTVVDPGWDQIRLEEKNAVEAQAALESAEGYDSTDISEGEGDKEYSTQKIVEDNAATEKQKKENAEKASADYQEFVNTSLAYNSISDEDTEAEKALRTQYGLGYDQYLKNSTGLKASGTKTFSKEEYIQNKIELDDVVSASEVKAKHDVYTANPTYRDARIAIAKSEYAKKAELSESETKKLFDANVNPAKPESMEAFSTLDKEGNMVSFESEYNNINPNQAGRILADGSRLGDKLRENVESKLTAQNDVESVRVNVKNYVESLEGKDAKFELVKAATGLDLGLFLKGDQQKLVEKQAKEDFKLLKSNVQKIASEADVIGSQIKNNGALLTKAHEDLKALGDVRSEIDKLKNGEYTTEAQVKDANQKISALVNDYTAKFKTFDKYRKAHSALNNAAARIGGEMKDLDVKVKDLGTFTEFIGDNHQIGTQMAWSAANAAIDLGQGFADFAYMANPFGALSDELIDYAGEDSLTASIVEGVRIAAAPFTGGLSMYSGDRREAMRDAIDGFQENVSSKIEQPPAFGSIKDIGSFAEWAAVTGIAQAPQLALMYATGGMSGLVLMGAGAAGSKYNEMEENRDVYKESGGLYGIDHSFASMFAVSTFTGAVEALSEKVTLGQLNAAGRSIKNEVFKASGKRGIAKYLRNDVFTKDAFRSTLRGSKDLFEEGGSEFLATVGANALTIASGDKSVGLWDGGLESFVTGAMISSTIKTPSLFRSAMAPFQSNTTSQILNNNLDIIEKHRDIASGEIEASAEAKQFAKDIIDEAVHENKLALELDIKRVDAYEDADKSKLINIESDNIDLRRKANAIAQDETLDESQKKEMIDDLQTKLDNNIAEKQTIIDKYPEDVVNLRYSETSLGRQPVDQQLEQNIEFAKKHSALYGMEVNDSMTTEQIREKYGEEAASSDGFVDGNNIVINKEVAAETGAVTVGSHELLHGILRKAMNVDTDLSAKVISQLKKEIGGQWSVVQQRIDDNYSPEYMAKNPDEYLTLVSDAIANNEITYEETIFDRIRDAFNEMGLFKKAGFNKIKFKTGKDVYRFLREYNKSIHKGALSSKIVKATKGEGEVTESGDITYSMTSDQRKAAAKSVKDLGTKNTNKSWRRGGADAAIKDMKDNGYFDALIASKYKVKPVPRDFVEKVYSEITPHIKRFKPEQNDNLFAYINSQIGNKAGNVYNKEYKVDEAMRGSKDIDAKTSEGAPVIQVAAETDTGVKSFEEQDMSMAAQAKRAKLAEQGKSESDKYSGLRTELGLEKPMMDKVRNAVMKTFGTKLPDVNSKKFKTALQKAYRTELKKPIQDMIGKGATYDTFLTESFPTVFKFLPKETLLQMERNIDPAKRIFTKSERITKPTEVDKLISDGLLPKDTNRLSGPTLITKLPYPGSRKVMAYFRGQNMENALGYKVGASTLGTRKDKLAMEMGVELGFDATMETLKDPAVLERRQGILELQGFDQKKNEAAIIGKQINRDPSVKFSKSSKETAESSPNKILEKTGSVNPVAYRLEDFISASTGKIKQKRLVDFSRELRDNGVLMELGKHTTDILSSFAKSFPQYLGDLRTTMSGGQGLSFFGLTPVFDKLAVGLKAGPKLADRFTYSGKGKTLNPNKVNKSNGKLKFKQGRETLSKETFVEQQSKKLDILESLFTAIQSHLKDNPSHAWFFARMVSDTVNNQSSIVRVSAPTMAFPVDNKGNLIYDQKIAEEHSFPQNNVGTLLLEAAITGKDIKEVMKIIRGSYMQMALLETHDVQVRQAGYSSKMPDVFWDKVVPRLLDGSLNIKNGLASMVRYVESGIDLNNYLVPGENQTITEYFGVGKFDNASQTLIDKQNELITKFLTGEITKKEATSLINEFAKVEGVIESAVQANTSTYDQAVANRSKFSKSGKAKGMSTFDFDETLIIDGENFIIATDPATGQQLEVKSHEWPLKGPDLAAAGFEFDFSDFAQVRGGKEGPLLQKMRNQISKYGPSNVFVLTARQQESAQPIHEWLNGKGISIPIENITGLGKSEGSAKGQWMLQKFAEGYNDMYFVDDALPNVDAVREVLDELDIKSKVVQAKIKFSKSGPKKMSEIISEGEADLSSDLNTILEQTKGVDRKKVFSAAKARKRGKNKGKFKFFVPPSADDFAGLMYAFMGKGKQGEKHHQFFKENLFDPFSKGVRHLNRVKQTVANDMKELRKAMPEVRKKLGKNIPGTEYTHEDAIRVYNWAKAGFDIPGLSETDKQTLINAVENDASLNAFAQGVNSIGNTPGGMVEPDNHWLGGNIALDLKEALDVARGTYLQQWKENKDILFTEANLNKIEAVYGSNFREALEDSLYRMEFGGNKSRGSGRLLNNFTNWIHGSIGTTMFLNARSAMLQMISNVNFVNWSDNNMVAAAGAFANQKQYWGDVSMIFNSPFLKQRRSGIQTDVNAAELLAQIKDSKNKAKAATAYLLQLGFTPTQIADSFAIATGGATFYRNRIKTYLKDGMTQADAETKAFEDMMEIAEETQQSTREDKISQQQASPLGKFILAFQNTPMQYNRLIKKAAQDLVNGRGDAKANISRIVYYGGIQNLIFYGLQSALFAALFSDDEEDQLTDKKKERVANGMVDTLLRGSGMGGAIVATVKNVILKFMKEEEKEQDDNWLSQANHANTLIEALNISPPIGIKARKLYSASQTWDFNRDVIAHMSKTDIDNPVYDAAFSATEAVTNLPLSRLYNKYQNISESLNADNEMWQRIAMFLGWSKWNFGIKNQDVVAAKGEVKEIKAVEAEERREMKKRAKDAERQAEEEAVIESNLLEQDEERADGKEDIKCAAVSRSGSRCGNKVKGGGNFCTIHEGAPQRADGEKKQCSHVKSNGDRCKMKTTNKSGKCYYHD